MDINNFVENNAEKTEIVDWIYSVKNDDTKVERIAKTLDKLLKSI